MRTFAQKQNQPQQRASASLARSNAPTSEPTHHMHPLLHLQRTIGNQAAQRLLRTNAEVMQRQESESALPAEPTEPVQLGTVELDLDRVMRYEQDTAEFRIPVTRSHVVVTFQGTVLTNESPRACSTVMIELFRGSTSKGLRTFPLNGRPHTQDYNDPGQTIEPGMYHFRFNTNNTFCSVGNPSLTARW